MNSFIPNLTPDTFNGNINMQEYYQNQKNYFEKENPEYENYTAPIMENRIYQIAQKFGLIYPNNAIDEIMESCPPGTIALRTGSGLNSITCLYSEGQYSSLTVKKVSATMLNWSKTILTVESTNGEKSEFNKLSDFLNVIKKQIVESNDIKTTAEVNIGKFHQGGLQHLNIDEMIIDLQREGY